MFKYVWLIVLGGSLLLGGPVESVLAQGASEEVTETYVEPEWDSGNIAWMLTSSALVLMMTAPGLALFYGGLVRKKNILGVMMQCVFLMGLMSIVWALWGYSLAFGGSGGFIGNFDYVLLNGVIPTWDAAQGVSVVPAVDNGIPHSVFMVFQGMFFIITPALICGAFAERMKFSAMCLYMVLWGTLVYCPIAHWVWGPGGWLLEGPYAALDFAGGTVVHISSGVSALVASILIGRRLGFGQEPMPPHNLTYTAIGAALLWVGWFGFNAGSAVAANAVAANAFVATHLAAAGGVISWSAAEWLLRGKPSILGGCSGAVAGSGLHHSRGWCRQPDSRNPPRAHCRLHLLPRLYNHQESLRIRRLARCVRGARNWRHRRSAAHGSVRDPRAITGDAEVYGLIEGGVQQFVNQVIGVAAAAALSIVGTLIILKILDATVGLRVSQDDEIQGLDLSQHGEEGYIFL